MQAVVEKYMPKQLADMYEPPVNTEKTIFESIFHNWEEKQSSTQM